MTAGHDLDNLFRRLDAAVERNRRLARLPGDIRAQLARLDAGEYQQWTAEDALRWVLGQLGEMP